MIVRNMHSYHRSVSEELTATKNRVRDLIGSNHWTTDGEHKEAVLRNILKRYLPGIYQVGRGFICSPEGSSKQIDILIINQTSPLLYKDGDLFFVTPDSVEAIIEVKTEANSLEETLQTIADNGEMVRYYKGEKFWSGLFAFDESGNEVNRANKLLRDLQSASNTTLGEPLNRIINCAALGPQIFSRYWQLPSEAGNEAIDDSAWHSYIFPGNENTGMAHSYFIGNLVWALSPNIAPEMRFAWYPIQSEDGKEEFRHSYIGLEGQAQQF